MKNKFRVLIAINKLSIAKVSDNTGIAKTTLYGLYYEKTQNPSLPIILKLCEYLNVTPNEFLGIENVNEKEA
ncbi:helix-turn-helix transcriptional regulator [Staphylococcus capitis]|uniref:helix-turn-helix domain-containing protein n=1 Tax=Staphylococcus TaxID=1279 RepID=UPI0005CB28A0|nr:MULTISPECIES: helix-turn-helix transcriptional regulator [Staphylococcus]MDH9707144.1 helix-turn-helix transcriptional regulator [Staphylococcus epidermidis]MDH9712667.1 helix-turn-helix transcriptional regulator [Staphylococcus epidermidis]MDH9919603.1 helix-turn-helix transcriptional regulator [Staphylococcus epidermidis]MDH9932486.1 helix-turn-helix transcriptional regulator [Staphylococcus epidermidis]MDH9937156.1 helix-turn-helix transcriptional regulator [Staphylococcus epidermidis]